MLRFDPNLRWMFTELPMLQRYGAAARAGFKGVEVAFPYEYPARQIADLLGEHGLTLVQVLTPCDWAAGERGIAALPGREADFRRSVESAVQYAVQVGGPMIHAMAGNIPTGMDRAQCRDVFLENIAYAAALTGSEGLTLILEPCCRARFPDYFYNRIDEGLSCIEAIGKPNVKLCFDTYHVQMEEGNLTETLRRAYPHVGHVQIGNVPGRHEPGTGEIHFPWFFEQLEALGWDRWIGCEYEPSGLTTDTLQWGTPYGIGTAR
ncbi:hydroxypyruvate isomerase family protein [Achromobacter agilis]|uniref:Hydroxypyruvate isomerase YgbM n=1 Tax=Achromobacter agilis TaxID=1353888 RepID=A0A446C942_9BURK|nr:TIM barrel protein [Achromobacter agilis]SSW64429.1 Putative hydroxypyruvate isomerase YgbM [Achromobacter agilis]